MVSNWVETDILLSKVRAITDRMPAKTGIKIVKSYNRAEALVISHPRYKDFETIMLEAIHGDITESDDGRKGIG